MKSESHYSTEEQSRIANEYWRRLAADCPRDGTPLRVGHYYSRSCVTWLTASCPECGRRFRAAETLMSRDERQHVDRQQDERRAPKPSAMHDLDDLIEFLQGPMPLTPHGRFTLV